MAVHNNRVTALLLCRNLLQVMPDSKGSRYSINKSSNRRLLNQEHSPKNWYPSKSSSNSPSNQISTKHSRHSTNPSNSLLLNNRLTNSRNHNTNSSNLLNDQNNNPNNSKNLLRFRLYSHLKIELRSLRHSRNHGNPPLLPNQNDIGKSSPSTTSPMRKTNSLISMKIEMMNPTNPITHPANTLTRITKLPRRHIAQYGYSLIQTLQCPSKTL